MIKKFLLLTNLLLITACSSVDSADKKVSRCDTKTPQPCSQSQQCFAKKYALDTTGAKIVSKVLGCTTQ